MKVNEPDSIMNQLSRLLILILILFTLPGLSHAQDSRPPTAAEVISAIRDTVTVPWMDETVDTFKAGDPGREVTGIVTTFMATQTVLERAVKEGHNLVITHEPTFYYHFDDLDHYGENVEVVDSKLDYIEDNGLVIFRFHDHWHRTEPDGIIEGMMRSWGWQEFLAEGEDMVFRIPPRTLEELAGFFRKKYSDTAIRVVGNPDLKVTGVGFAPGASGAGMQVGLLKRDDVQAVIGGEGTEWEAVEYTRDAVEQGRKKGLIYIGHANSEEAGMKYLARWLDQVLPYELPILHVPAGNPFWQP